MRAKLKRRRIAPLNKAIVTPLIVASALLMEAVDSTVITTSLPLIAADLTTDPLSLKLAMTTYLLSLAVFIPASGWIADRFGARNVFRLALATFVIGSILSGSVTTLWQLVLTRALQGLGGAMMLPVARLIVIKSVPREQLVVAFVWITVPAMIGPMLGPPVGGFIATYFHWRWIFWINVPFGIIGILLATWFIDRIREPHPGVFDMRGFVLSALGFAGLVFGFSLLGGDFVSWGVNAAIFAVGIAAIALYLRHARMADNPLLDVSLFKIPTYRVGVAGGMIFRLCIGAVPFLLPLLLQVGFGLTPLQSGLITFAGGVGALFMKLAAPPILRHLGFRNTLLANGLLVAASFAVVALFTAQTPHALIITILLASGFFRSLQFTALNGLVFCDVDQPRASKATSLYAALFQAALAAGVALGAAIVDLTFWFSGRDKLGAQDFGPAFILLGLAMVASLILYWRMPAGAGEGIAGPMFVKSRAGAAQERKAAK